MKADEKMLLGPMKGTSAFKNSQMELLIRAAFSAVSTLKNFPTTRVLQTWNITSTQNIEQQFWGSKPHQVTLDLAFRCKLSVYLWLTNNFTKWIAMDCRSVLVTEDRWLAEVLQIQFYRSCWSIFEFISSAY